jgi:hypothetical protein
MIRHRIEQGQGLGGQSRRPLQAARDGDPEISAGAVAAEPETTGIRTKLSGMADGPKRRGSAIADRSRIGPFGRQRVVDGDDHSLGSVADLTAHTVVRLDAAERESPTVKEEDERQPE